MCCLVENKTKIVLLKNYKKVGLFSLNKVGLFACKFKMCKLSQQNKYFILLSNGHSRAIRQVENSRGLVVKAEDSCPRGPGFKPTLWRPFFRHHLFISKLGTKIMENSNLTMLHVL